MAGVEEEVTIKKEIEDPTDSPEQNDAPESGQGQSDNQNTKLTKVWTDEETRSLIKLAKAYIPKFKDSSYSKKQLLEDIAGELQKKGFFTTTPENVRNKMKYLRTRYKNVLDYNAKHVEKRAIPFADELVELYSLDYFDNGDFYDRNGNGSNDVSFRASGSKRKSTIPASHVDLRSVVTTKKKTTNQIIHKGTKFAIKRKTNVKSRSQPLYQCGLCMEKFKTSHNMHDHVCKAAAKASNEASKRKANTAHSNSSNVFHWNSLITMQFLELLKEFQESHKNANFRKGNIWNNMSTLMKRRGYNILPKELEKKWVTLSSAFEKTMKYNKTHKDKKKCAFFKRLTDLYKHPASFSCFKSSEPVKMTVEVSPFSFASREPSSATSRPSTTNPAAQRKNSEDQKPNHNSIPELMLWLQNTWTEYKMLEKKKEALQAQRHNELMEMLSFLVDNSSNNSIR
ncbi:unnamed protein product [Larinioides sclopetarius]|uniref:Myb/SANT-like DNA-binding domain-containing protein n=1 Tax=Larinioides sclopetarius TaxID=280406 RepID=A0AAV1Z1S7_9ARAC